MTACGSTGRNRAAIMKIQGFIFNWKGHEANALALEEKIGKLIEVTVINSEEQLSGSHPGWVHLDDTAYFSAQWNKALELFDADILFHIQADADFDEFETLFARARSVFEKHRPGVYEPNVDYTDIQYDKLRLQSLGPDLFVVPFTDCTCWFITGDIVRQLPPVDLSQNKYGWGIPRAIAALSHLSGRPCVRDYAFTIRHPRGRGYSSESAAEQLKAYVGSLGPEVRDEISRLEEVRARLREKPILTDTLLITAASAAYGPSLLALLGSLHLNWPNHPPVLVYDIGLDATTLKWLEKYRIPVRRVPPFCPHWRQHYTWKLWCLYDAPARNIVWMDAGLVVLRPVDEILDAVHTQGYFLTTHHELLDWEASDAACEGCGVPSTFRRGKLTLPATLMGFRKAGKTLRILEEALEVGFIEKNIAPTKRTHRFEQAIISLLVYKHLGRVVIADSAVYSGALSPEQIPGQKIWVHRRRILRKDIEHFASHIASPCAPHVPSPPYPLNRAKGLSHLYRMYWCFSRGELITARENLDSAFRIDPTLKDEFALLADKLLRYSRSLKGFGENNSYEQDFLDWALKQLGVINGAPFISKLTATLRRAETTIQSSQSG
jgi:hypothetical protein